MKSDFHVHSSYSDGSPLPATASAAADAGLDAVGFADHCSVTEAHRDRKLLWNRNFDRTYERRREALELLAKRHELTVYDAVVSLVESELFEVVAHLDVVENHPELHGLTTDDHRDRVADALANSRTLPEINASHATPGGEYEIFHPSSGFVEELLERGIEFAVGTDAHDPGHFAPRRSELAAFLDERGIDPASPLAA